MFCQTLLFAALSICGVNASPIIAHVAENTLLPKLQQRALIPFDTPSIDLGFEIKNKNLTIPTPGGSIFTVECIECKVFGFVDFSTTSVVQNANLIDQFKADPVAFVSDAEKNIIKALDFNVEMQLSANSGGVFKLGLDVDGQLEQTFTLFSTETPIGASIDGITIGIVAFVDLIIEVTAEVDLTAGFQVSFPTGGSILFNPLSGEIIQPIINGAKLEALPATVTVGSANFTASLRLRIQAGIEIDVPGLPTSFHFDCGVFTDIIKYEAQLASSVSCAREIREDALIDIGAFAELGVIAAQTSFGAFPTVMTTLFSTALPTICLTSTATGTISIVSGTARPTSHYAAVMWQNTTSSALMVASTSISKSLPGLYQTSVAGKDVIVTRTTTIFATVCSSTTASY